MRALLNDLRQMTISDLIDELENPNGLIVFYRTKNERTGTPCFLKKDKNGWYFMSPVYDYDRTYEHKNLRDTLETCLKSRRIYVMHRDEYDKLFKVQSIIDSFIAEKLADLSFETRKKTDDDEVVDEFFKGFRDNLLKKL